MYSYTKKLTIVLGMVVGVLWGASPAQANLQVRLSVDGGAATLVIDAADFTSGTYTNTSFGGVFKIQVLGSASDNGATLSDLLSSTTRVQNIGTGTHTLTIEVSQNNYTLPGTVGADLLMTSSASGTVNVVGAGGPAANTETFQSYVNNVNTEFNITGATTSGPQTSSLNNPGSWTSAPNNATAVFTRTTAEYTVTTIQTLTIGAGGDINFSTQTNLVAVPAPAAVVLALTGLPFVGAGCWLRRRKALALNG